MSHATLFLIIDAGRRDYIRPETMPFLHGLAQHSLRGSFISPPGFAQRTAFFTGVYPDTSGNLSAFVFDPENSPFAWLRKLGPLPNVVRPRKVFVPARRAIRAISKWTSDCYHTDPAWIPPRYQPFFRPCEDSKPVHDPGALGRTSLFDLCREHGLTYTYRAHPVSGDDEKIHAGLVRDLRAGKDYRLYVAQFSILDQQGHIHGPGSATIQQRCLQSLDEKIAQVHAALGAGYDAWDLVVCADHGMAPVQQRVDVQRALRKLPLKPARDYVVFVNSTLAVFWYITEKGRVEIEAFLPTLQGGRPLDEQERRKRRIPADRRWGDRMFAADPGVLFWPDYFHVSDSVIRGMHGYLDKRAEDYGMAVLASSNGGIQRGSFDPRPLVDVFPTLCNLLDVPVPPGQEGRSVLEPHAVLPA
jgi:predicted AlkP superfamily pyrophosphatase or phosphodiesterase